MWLYGTKRRRRKNTNNTTTANTTSQQAIPLFLCHLCFLEHHSEDLSFLILFFCFVVLAQGKNQSYPSEGGDSCSARRRFPCVSSFTAVPALFWPIFHTHPQTLRLLPFFLPRFVELKCSSRKEGQWMHTWFCFKQTNSFHWWCWWHIINDINKNWFLTSWYVSIWIWLLWCF